MQRLLPGQTLNCQPLSRLMRSVLPPVRGLMMVLAVKAKRVKAKKVMEKKEAVLRAVMAAPMKRGGLRQRVRTWPGFGPG